MIIVSTREFRANQKKYFEMAEKQLIVINRRNSPPMMLSPFKEDQFLSKEEWDNVNKGMDDIAKGRSTRIKSKEELDTFLNSL